MNVEIELSDGSIKTVENPVEVEVVNFQKESPRSDVIVSWKEMVDALDALESSSEIDYYTDATIRRVSQ